MDVGKRANVTATTGRTRIFIYPPFQFLQAPYPPDEINPLARPRIVDPEYRSEDLFLENGHVEPLHRIGVGKEVSGGAECVPCAFDIHPVFPLP